MLEVYVTEECAGCAEARLIAGEMAAQFPALDVRVIPIDRPGAEKPDAVFAVPTFVLQSQTVSLGNPDRRDLCSRIETLLRADGHAP